MNSVSFGNGNEYGKYFYEPQNIKSQPRRNQYISEGKSYNPPPYYSETYKPDSFEKKAQSKKPQQTTKKSAPAKKAPAKKNNGLTPFQKLGLFLSGVAVGGGAVGVGNAVVNYEPKPGIGLYRSIEDYDDLSYVAKMYNSDENLILAYNGVENVQELSEKEEVKVPHSFDLVQDKIDSLQEKLYNKKLTVDEQNSLLSEIDALKDKQQTQRDVAWSYQDGKYVYFIMNETINVEEFKKIYGIEDKALRRYNDLECTYESVSHGPGENDSHYKDYTGACLYKGETYKVGVKDFVK